MRGAKSTVRTDGVGRHESTGKSSTSMLKLRLLIHDLMTEVESLDERSLSFSETSLLENRICNFYEEVERFESALIRSALRRTNGHQINAARLLNLNPSTLNAKIKQYHIRHVFDHDETAT